MKKYVLVFVLVFSCNKTKNNIEDHSNLPENKNQLVVLDLSNLFLQTQIDSLTNKIIAFEKKSSNEIAIITVDSIFPYKNICNYSTDISNFWGHGKKEKKQWIINCLIKE